MKARLQKYWFLFGLFFLALITLADTSGTIASAGSWVGARHGPQILISLIFLLSGLSLQAEQIRQGVSDLATVGVAVVMIFAFAPVVASLTSLIPLAPGVRIGLYITAVMPTTLSSGVVMTGAAGGNIANALMITILANILGIFTIPCSLQVLIGSGSGSETFAIDKAALMLQIASLVIGPLLLGLAVRRPILPVLRRLRITPAVVNQVLVLTMVWIALSGSRSTIVSSMHLLGAIVLLVFAFHAALLAGTFLMSRLFHFGPGRREAVVFMGGQKTLPLSMLVQMTLFPQYGEALVVCVLHHIVHLMMDGYLVGRLAASRFSDSR